jgi:hypothetical protein
MLTNGSPPTTANMAPLGGLFGPQQRPGDDVGASDNNAGNTPSKDTRIGHPTNEYPPPPGYCYLPSQPPFPGPPQFYHPAPFYMTPSSQPGSGGAPQEYLSFGPSWQRYDFPQGGYGGPEMFLPQQFTGHGPSSPGAPQEHPAQAGNHPVNGPTSSSSTR